MLTHSLPFVLLDELEEFVDGFVFGDVFEDCISAFIDMHLSIGATDIAVVGVGHLAGSVDDAAHDGYL